MTLQVIGYMENQNPVAYKSFQVTVVTFNSDLRMGSVFPASGGDNFSCILHRM